MQKGFTLIEMLVVVLIIGILASIALPQYQRSIERARAAQAWQILKTIAEAERAYVLQNREYAGDFNRLGINLPLTGTEKWDSARTNAQTRSNADWSFQLRPWSNSNNSTPAMVILAGRLKGPYKGAGFAIGLGTGSADNGDADRGDWFVCEERTDRGLLFQGEPGSYCVKVFKGEWDYDGPYERQYRLPK